MKKEKCTNCYVIFCKSLSELVSRNLYCRRFFHLLSVPALFGFFLEQAVVPSPGISVIKELTVIKGEALRFNNCAQNWLSLSSMRVIIPIVILILYQSLRIKRYNIFLRMKII